MFADQAKIYLRSGKGGDGHVSFRREKYVPAGGPDGGDGGKGGDVIFEVDPGMNTLFYYRHHHHFKAGNGQEGGKKRCHGADGADIVLRVPEGTVIREEKTGEIIADMSGETKRLVVLAGGRGGRGNMNFATPTNQAPRFAEPGKPAIEINAVLELKLVADVALVGFPNAGKSTFLSRVTNAKPKIADYPFTTMEPQLGVVDFGDGRGFVIADMPGLIEGASKGTGLGHRFLKHIERTRVLIHLVDLASFDGRDPVDDVRKIHAEMHAYLPELMEKPIVIAANKIDAIAGLPDDPLPRLREAMQADGYDLYPISAVSGEGVQTLLEAVYRLLSTSAPPIKTFEQSFFPAEMAREELAYTIKMEEADEGRVFIVEGPKIERLLDYTDFDTERGFIYFQRFLKDEGILEALRREGIAEGDEVRMYGHSFDYYPEEEEEDADIETAGVSEQPGE